MNIGFGDGPAGGGGAAGGWIGIGNGAIDTQAKGEDGKAGEAGSLHESSAIQVFHKSKKFDIAATLALSAE